MARLDDQAGELEELERESILERQRSQAEKQARYTLSHCQDCGEEMDERRLALGGVTRCVICQEDFESRTKRGLR